MGVSFLLLVERQALCRINNNKSILAWRGRREERETLTLSAFMACRLPVNVVPTAYRINYTGIDLEVSTTGVMVMVKVVKCSFAVSVSVRRPIWGSGPVFVRHQHPILEHIHTLYLFLTYIKPPFPFAGIVAVDLTVASPTRKITLHCLDLAIEDASVEGQEASSISVNLKDETVTLAFLEDVKPGDVALTMRFAGKLNNQMRGLYYSDYTNLKGERRHMACTQFEATDARRAFPCWDEPAFKATFQVSGLRDLLERGQ